MSPKLKPEVAVISRWLHKHWDPIGCGVPEDEYDSYALPLYGMLFHGASPEEVAARLSEYQDMMGMPKHADELLPVAEQLIAAFPNLSR
jgi:hypothetical protein